MMIITDETAQRIARALERLLKLLEDPPPGGFPRPPAPRTDQPLMDCDCPRHHRCGASFCPRVRA